LALKEKKRKTNHEWPNIKIWNPHDREQCFEDILDAGKKLKDMTDMEASSHLEIVRCFFDLLETFCLSGDDMAVVPD
jgi:hypothetical protein